MQRRWYHIHDCVRIGCRGAQRPRYPAEPLIDSILATLLRSQYVTTSPPLLATVTAIAPARADRPGDYSLMALSHAPARPDLGSARAPLNPQHPGETPAFCDMMRPSRSNHCLPSAVGAQHGGKAAAKRTNGGSRRKQSRPDRILTQQTANLTRQSSAA